MKAILIAALLSGTPQFDYDGNGLVNGGSIAGNLTLNNDKKLNMGTSGPYWFIYNSSSTQWEMWTTNSDGGGTDAIILTVDDGTKTSDFRGRITNSAAVLNLGTSASTSHSLVAGDVLFGGGGEFNGTAYFDNGAVCNGNCQILDTWQLVFGTSSNARMLWNSSQTSPALSMSVDNTTHTLHIMEVADAATNYAMAAQTHPTVVVHSSNASPTTEYRALRAAGTQGELFKTLTEAGDTTLINIPITTLTAIGGTIHYTVFCADASNVITRAAFTRFVCTNKADTETCNMTDKAGTSDNSIIQTDDGSAIADSSGAGTLTYTLTLVGATNSVNVTLNATCSLTQTTLRAYYHLELDGPGEPLPQ